MLCLITADRLAASLLKLRYNSVFTINRVKVAIIVTWLAPLLTIPSGFAVIFIRGGKHSLKEAVDKFQAYFYPMVCLIFFLFTALSYTVIFVEYVKSGRRSTSTQQRKSIRLMFVESKFSVALIIVLVNMVFLAVPELIVFALRLKNGGDWKLTPSKDGLGNCHSNVGFVLSFDLPNVCDTVDAFCYIFLYTPVRNVFTKTARRLFRINSQSKDLPTLTITPTENAPRTLAVLTTVV